VNVVVVDTSAWIPYFKGVPNADLDLALREGRVFLAPVVAAELLSSKLRPSERKSLGDFLKELPLCEAAFDHWSRVGELRVRLATKGINLSTPDAHVAQCALDLEGYLLTEDAVFKKVSGAAGLRLL
jgi:tRNA(fMet)-specific endonuclease VapC